MENNTPSEAQDITQKAARGVGWNYISFGLGKLLSFITISILAHMLTPKQFGLVSLATVAIYYLSSVKELGLSAALIHLRSKFDEAANTVFSVNVIFGVTLSLITLLAAPLIAAFFEEPAVTPVLRVLGASFFIKSLGSVHLVILERNLDFKQKIIPQISNAVVKGVISITLALLNFGVWALVAGQLAGAITEIVVLWIVVPWKPQPTLKWELLKELFQFGISVFVVNIVSIIEDNFDYLIIGKVLGTIKLGIYTIAYRLPEMLAITTLWVMASVFFPMFAAIQNQSKVLKENFLKTIFYVQMIIVPICFGLFIAADPIIRVFFGEQWLEAIPIMRLLAIYALVVSIGYHAGDYYKAIGKPDILVKIEVPIFFIRIAALWFGAQYNMVGVAIAHISVAALEAIIRLIVSAYIINLRFTEILSKLTPYIAGAALLALTIPAFLLTQNSGDVLKLIAIVLSGAIGYLGTLWLIERKSILEFKNLIGNKAS